MKILLAGASGLLGSAFARAASRRKHDVIGLVGSYPANVPGLTRQIPLDLRDLAKLESLTLELFPDAIVNCAAISIPRECAANPEDSRLVNALVPEKLALLSRHLFARFIHISTDQVFDGKNAPYKVDHEPNSIDEYGNQKIESEERALELNPEFASIIRVPLLNGNSLTGKRSLHEQLLAAWSDGNQTALFEDEFRQPCSTDNLADVLVEICERSDIKGRLHWAGQDRLSRYEIGTRLLDHFGLPQDFVKRSARGSDPRFANRQGDLSLDLQPLEGKLKTRPQSFAEQLDSLAIPKPLRDWYNSM